MKTFRYACIVVCILLASFVAEARTRRKHKPPKPLADAPQTVVWKYCALDLQGARLSAHASGAQQIRSLALWQDDSSAETVIVTRDFKVGAVTTRGAVANVTVEYHNIGLVTDGTLVSSKPQSESMTFVLQKQGENWRIARPNPPSHASPGALAAHMEDDVRAEKDVARKSLLQATLKQLRDWRGEAPTIHVAARPAAPAPQRAVMSQPVSAASQTTNAVEKESAAPAGPAVDEEDPEPAPEPDSPPPQ